MALEDYREEEQPKIVVTDVTRNTLLEMSRWTKFLSILGFVFISLMLLGGAFVALAINSISSSLSPVLVSLGAVGLFMVYVLIVAIDFYPIYALLKYSANIKAALQNNDQERFDRALKYLRNMFIYIGVLFIVLIGLYAISFIFKIVLVAVGQ